MIRGFSHSVYFAPRGKERLMRLGNNLAQRYLQPQDGLIGLIGDAGAGKSVLIRGMFPGLTLTNDDMGINLRPLPLMEHYQERIFSNCIYHLDARFECAFYQPWELVEAVDAAIAAKRRVVVEHYDLLGDKFAARPDLLIGIGEEVILTKPWLFGPKVQEIKEIVFASIHYRRMAHTAEDLTGIVIKDMGYQSSLFHGDVRSGFVLEFESLPDLSIDTIQKKVEELIERKLDISYIDDECVSFGGRRILCTGPRVHVKNTGDIEGFVLLPEFYKDNRSDHYLLVGLVGEQRSQFKLLR